MISSIYALHKFLPTWTLKTDIYLYKIAYDNTHDLLRINNMFVQIYTRTKNVSPKIQFDNTTNMFLILNYKIILFFY